MVSEKHLPNQQLRPYIKHFVVLENELENRYKVLPSPELVMGFQYRGQLTQIKDNVEIELTPSGVTGIADSYKIFKNSASIATILIYFTEIGFTHFTSLPANELFNLSLSLDDVFDKNKVYEVQEKLTSATTVRKRIRIVEQFFQSQLKDIQSDTLIIEALKIIYQSKGSIRIKDLTEKLFISQSPFEKRFRKVVGTTPKKFASIIRFNAVLDNLNESKSLAEICYDNNFFDQAHFIKDFKQFTGDTPEHFKRFS